MRFLTMIFCAFLTANLGAQTVPRQAWTVDTEDLRMRNLSMIYGETLDLECTFRNYFSALNIEGASVTLHARTNGMDAAESYQVTGYSEAGGKAVVRVDVDAWLPQGLDSVDYTLAVVRAGTTRILRAFGTVYLRGSSAANNHVPMPMSVYAVLESELTNHIAWAEAKAILWDDAATNKTDTLASVASRGDFAGTETIHPYMVNAHLYSMFNRDSFWVDPSGTNWIAINGGDRSSGNNWIAIGDGKYSHGNNWIALGGGQDSRGNDWSALGRSAGCAASGDFWTSVGLHSGDSASGDYWTAIGRWTFSGESYISNSLAIGAWAGFAATGENKLYMDVFSSRPNGHTAVGDAIYIDNGQANIGRVGPFAPTTPNRLRGDWQLDDGTQLNKLAGKLDAADGIATNLTIVGTANVAELNINGEPVLTASTFLPPFTNMLLFADGGTNYYPRWDHDIGTFIVTGVPQ